MSRIYHVNVNCSDLTRSHDFYCGTFDLTPLARTTPQHPQPGAAFGLDEVQWDAWMLAGASGMDGVVLDLLEWKVPTSGRDPVGAATDYGFSRLILRHPDLAAVEQRLAGGAGHLLGGPVTIELGGGRSVDVLTCLDPDGTVLEIVSGEVADLTTVAVNCRDLEQSIDWYRTHLGLERGAELDLGNVGAIGLADDAAGHAVIMRDPTTGFGVELINWTAPPMNDDGPRAANDLGLFRMALFTDDIAADHRRLVDDGIVPFAPPAALDMGPGLPDDLMALFFPDPNGACIEYIQPPNG